METNDDTFKALQYWYQKAKKLEKELDAIKKEKENG